MGDPPPLYATPRDEGRRTRGNELAEIARLLGFELMPWQRRVVDVAMEVGSDGRPVYRNVIVTVPRQCGKTALIMILILHRMAFWDPSHPQMVLFTTQTGQDALSKFRLELVPQLRRSKLWRALALVSNESNNQPGLRSTRNQSAMSILGSSETSGHGRTAHLAIIDEAMAARDSTRQQAMMYALRTNPDAQFWVVSTAGDMDSLYLRDKVVTGRAIVENGESQKQRTAYFEWGLAEDQDWRDPSNWWRAIPALGYTIEHEAVLAEFQAEETNSNDFRRASLNQWPVIASDWAIPEPAWERARTNLEIPPGPFWAAADAPSPHRGDGAIAVCAKGTIEIIATGNGASWAGEKLRALANENLMDLESIALWKNGQLKTLGQELELEGIPISWLSGVEMPHACGRFYEAVVQNQVGIRPSVALDAAVKRAEMRDRDTGMSTWRSRDGKSIAALWAAAMAYTLCEPADDDAGDDDTSGITTVDDFDDDELDRVARELGL